MGRCKECIGEREQESVFVDEFRPDSSPAHPVDGCVPYTEPRVSTDSLNLPLPVSPVFTTLFDCLVTCLGPFMF